MKKLFSTLLSILLATIYLVDINAYASERIYAGKMIEYLIVPEDTVIYYDKSKKSEIQPKIPDEAWEEVVGHLETAKDGSTWYRLYLINGNYADRYYQNNGWQAYISTENIIRTSDKALKDFYEGNYLASYYFEGKKRIVLFSETNTSKNDKILHIYGFDNVEDIGNYDGLDTSNLSLAFHKQNSITNCSNDLVREYLNKSFMADSDQDGVDEVWYTYPNLCVNPYEPERFHVVMQENKESFSAMKIRKSAGPAHAENAFEAIESDIEDKASNEIAQSVLTWLVSSVMTEKMYVDKTKKELLGKWFIKSLMVDNEFNFPKNEQILLEFLEDGTLLYNNPRNEYLPRGKHSYTWFFDENKERKIFITINDMAYEFTFNSTDGTIFISDLSTYFMFKKIK